MNASLEIPVLNPLPAGPSHPFTALLGPEQVPDLTEELLRRGYDEAQLTKLFRENILRVFEQATGS
jgi:microsomal dipeptidase-like Zn-dependent dipeptidase